MDGGRKAVTTVPRGPATGETVRQAMGGMLPAQVTPVTRQFPDGPQALRVQESPSSQALPDELFV